MKLTLKQQISEARDSMEVQEFIEFLKELDEGGKVRLGYDYFDTVIDYAKEKARSMFEELDSGEWFGCQLACLNALEDLSESEYDYIRIDPYGYPQSFESTQEVMDELLGADSIDDEERK